MNFLIADTFTTSLARLTAAEQKAVKTTAFDLQLNPANPGMSFHRLDRAKDRNFWSVRASSDIRLIVHRTSGSLLLCYAGHHDEAYSWAERRRLETHPTTGAAQLVEIREQVREVVIRHVVAPAPQASSGRRAPAKAASQRLVLAHVADEELLAYGVPPEWLADARGATEDGLLALADHLPAEAAEALIELATGGTPRKPVPAAPAADPFEHPDAQRRFRVVADVEELARALDYPWDRWTVFLHPSQRELVERSFGGPARVAGSAGTGKTIVALHRAAHLARGNPDARVLLTTFSESLAGALRVKLGRLIGNEPRLAERLEVEPLSAMARRLYESRFGRADIAPRSLVRELVETAAREHAGSRFSLHFLTAEWEQVVDAWQLRSWEAYRDVVRLGRKTRLPEKQRELLWELFGQVRQELDARTLLTEADLLQRLTAHLLEGGHAPYDFIIVDEAQDVGVAQLRLLAALGAGRSDALFFAGDLGQRIFQLPFSWKSLGVDIRGRSGVLRVNYRTSHQIRTQADGLLGKEMADVDGNTEDRSGTVSVFNGPPPMVATPRTEEAEISMVGEWLAARAVDGVSPDEMALLVRSDAQFGRARAAAELARLPYSVLDGSAARPAGSVAIGTMHLAKGLEFRAVAVMACDDEVLPFQERIESVADDGDLEDVYDTERHLLYVACTRARDYLIVSGVNPGSEFLEDLLA